MMEAWMEPAGFVLPSQGLSVPIRLIYYERKERTKSTNVWEPETRGFVNSLALTSRPPVAPNSVCVCVCMFSKLSYKLL